MDISELLPTPYKFTIPVGKGKKKQHPSFMVRKAFIIDEKYRNPQTHRLGEQLQTQNAIEAIFKIVWHLMLPESRDRVEGITGDHIKPEMFGCEDDPEFKGYYKLYSLCELCETKEEREQALNLVTEAFMFAYDIDKKKVEEVMEEENELI